MAVKVLNEYQTPAVQCAAGDIFIQEDDDGFWVCLWDGAQALCTDKEPCSTMEEAVRWAKEVEENMEAVMDD